MSKNRRDFLKVAGFGLAGLGLSTGLSKANGIIDSNTAKAKNERQRFNMCGYAAPKLDIVRIGFVGVGGRGVAAVTRIRRFNEVVINGLADLRETQVDKAKGMLVGEFARHQPITYSGKVNEWKRLCERDDIDLVYIATHWELHAEVACYAMECGKHVAIEVPSAQSLEECWRLVETSEKTRRHCVMLENCCYDSFELLTLNMARQGLFGEIIHCEGAYIHNISKGLFTKHNRWNMWRLKENATRNGNLYATHGLGPVAQILNVNRGDNLNSLVSMSTNDFTLGGLADELASEDDFYEPYAGNKFRGNMNTSIIRTARGKTIMLQHDTSSPRPYSRIHMVSGTKGMAQKYPSPARISFAGTSTSNHGRWLNDQELKEIEEKYRHPIIKQIGSVAKKMGGHGGMDFMVDWRMIDCLRNGLPMDIDVYDVALWGSIGPLTEKSVAEGSMPIKIPDFTRGSWKTNQPVDLIYAQGGNTTVNLSGLRGAETNY